MKRDSGANAAQRKDDGYSDQFATGVTHGVRNIDCSAMERARQAGFLFDTVTRQWLKGGGRWSATP